LLIIGLGRLLPRAGDDKCFNALLTTPLAALAALAALTSASCVPKTKQKKTTRRLEISTQINADALISLLIMMLKPRLRQVYDLIRTLVRPYLLNSS
jgi:hypothetical protein